MGRGIDTSSREEGGATGPPGGNAVRGPVGRDGEGAVREGAGVGPRRRRENLALVRDVVSLAEARDTFGSRMGRGEGTVRQPWGRSRPSGAAGRGEILRRLTAPLVLMAVLLVASPLFAQNRIEFLSNRLKASDVRVRTQAALALGGTNDDAAVPPLCGALDDASDLVRQSVAAALKRLGRSSATGCLRQRLAKETDANVKLQIGRAIDALGPGDAAPESPASANPLADPPKLVPTAKYYLAFSSITNHTGRSQLEIDQVVGGALRSKIEALGGYQRAPVKEKPDAARAILAKRKMKGYYLSISVDPFDYSNGNLRVRIKLSVFTYPGKELRGEVPAGVTQTGVRRGDTAAENNLLAMAAARGIELFTQNFQ